MTPVTNRKKICRLIKRSASTIGKFSPELEELFFYRKKKEISSKISKQINK